jgi:hypothetical protein
VKTYEELERLADAVLELDLDRSKGDRLKYFQLIKNLTKQELRCIADIHERRAAVLLAGDG